MIDQTSISSDIQRLLDQRHHLGGELWTSPDHRLNKGGVFSLMSSLLLLKELDYPKNDLIQSALDLIWKAQRPDGRFKLAPDGAYLPCQTINALAVLCAWGEGHDPRLASTIAHLIATQEPHGGWRCLKFSFGRGPETDHANPGPTLSALLAFARLEDEALRDQLQPSVQFLLNHWEAKVPWGPCHYGMGTLFHQVEYPFQTYNLFSYVYTLSFYPLARKDPRYHQALEVLRSTLVDGMIRVERTHPKLADFAFCRKGEVSHAATRHWETILRNMAHESSFPHSLNN
jgi:hypothetical protein